MDDGASNNLQRKKAGESTFEMARKRRLMVLVIGIVAILIILVIGFVIFPNVKTLGIGGSGLLTLFLIIMILPNITEKWMNRKAKESRRARRGAKAEEKVGGLLDGLNGEFDDSRVL